MIDASLAVVLQAGTFSIVGPTGVLVGAIVVAVFLRVLERMFGPMNDWAGAGTAEQTSSTSSASANTSGSTAGVTLDTGPNEVAETETTADSNVGTPNAVPTEEQADETRHAKGTFKTPAGGGSLMVTSLGFEPDLVFFTGASQEKPGFAEGWSHGVAHRTGMGSIDQYAVSIADTGAGSAGGGIREDAALDLPVDNEGGTTDAVWGKVNTTVDEGFQFEVNAPSAHDRRTKVQYHAVSLPDSADASVGTFGFGTEPRKGKVDLGVDADYVSLTASTGGRPLTRQADRPVAISHGTVIEPAETPVQSSIGSSVNLVGGGYAARNDRALHLLHPGDDEIAGATSMRVTTLGSTMRLYLEEIHEPAPVAFAVYTAVDMGTDPAPMTGMIRAPGPEKGARRDVDTDFTPSTVSLSSSAGAVDDHDNRTFSGGLPMLGWSHSVLAGEPGGLAGKMPLRTVGEDGLNARASLGMGIEEDGFVLAAMDDVEGDRPLVLFSAWPGELE